VKISNEISKEFKEIIAAEKWDSDTGNG
jgi:hypothetical protein